MNMDNRERIEINKYEKPIQDANGDIGREQWVDYLDGSKVGHGKIEKGPSVGHEWLKGEGGTLENAPEALNVAGVSGLKLTEMRAGRWGVILEQGKNPKSPKKGDTWFWAHASTEETFDRVHGDDELVQREGVQKEVDDQNRTTYEVKTGGNGSVKIERTAYFDEDGYSVLTGKHVAGSEAGKVWEERRTLRPDADQATKGTLATPKGNMSALGVRGFSRDLAPSDAQVQKGETVDSRTLHLIMQGEWEPKAKDGDESA